MLSTYVKALVVLLASGFMTTSFAEYNYDTHKTHCVGTACKKVVVKKKCVGDACHTSVHESKYHD